ncbi:helix-turn-helix domain-containing protein [Planococcus halotolerans]|uniref:Uncharacterized protein n=1 Tax=Planococcus halotolerans TaxID=2233542 RepID=A0A365KKD9_9BACL|nr:helix-turn-helix transcriptional regulator [Planococcus halotolerans]RAZ73603.1 hypothetical protein DP120_16835 [Planococcus halotolerans]
MELKKSALAGPALERLIAASGMSGEEIAEKLNISPQHGSNIKNSRRNMQADIARESLNCFDNPAYSMDILYEFSGGYTSPVLRGKNIEDHRLAFWVNAKQEIAEGLEKLEVTSLAKPPSEMTALEMDGVIAMIDELIESKVHIDNFLMRVQVEYEVSIKDRLKSLKPRWKAKGWLQ